MFSYINILSYYKLFLYFNLCLSVMLDSLSCSVTSISFEPRSWRGILDTTLCDEVCQWLATGRWFSSVSSTNKTATIKLKHCQKWRKIPQTNQPLLITSCSFNLCLSVAQDSLSCSFTFIYLITTSCSFTLICVQV